jgi:transposase
MVSDVPEPDLRIPEQFRREAIELLRQGRPPGELAESLGVSPQTLRNWRRQDQLDRRERDDGVTTDERAELARLRRENQRLRQERDLLKRAAAFFATESGTR